VFSAAAIGAALSAESAAAGVADALVTSTVKIATAMAGGKLAVAAATGAGGISANVAGMLKGAMKMIFMAKLKAACLVGSGVVLAGGAAVAVAEKAAESQRERQTSSAQTGILTVNPSEQDLTSVNGCRFEAIPTSTVCLVRHDSPEVTWLDLNLRITRNSDTNAVRLHPYFGVRITAPDKKVHESYRQTEYAKPPRAMTEEDYYDLNSGKSLDITLEDRRTVNMRRAIEPRSVLHVWKDRDAVSLQWARVVNWYPIVVRAMVAV